MLAVERHYLLTYGGGFTEHFYGLKRERVLRIKGGEVPRAQLAVPDLVRETLKLRTSDVWKNLAVMVGLPYLKRKLDESYDIHAPQAVILGPSYDRDILPPDATFRQRIQYYYKWFLRHVYPSINAAYYFSLLAFNLAYLFDNTKYSSPFLWLIGTRIRRLGAADYRAIELATNSPPAPPSPGARPGQTNSLFQPRTITALIIPRLLSSLKILLPTSIFALKFLEWWHASDFARQLSRKAAEGLELPPPIVSGLPAPAPSKPSLPSSLKSKGTTANPPPQTVPNTVSLSSPPSTTIAPTPPPSSLPSSNPNTSSKPSAPISTTTHLPILTVPAPTPQTSSLCPICLHPIQTPTAAQTGYVFCYTCIFKWVDGSHERQLAWMEGGGVEGWGEEEDDDGDKYGDDRGEGGKDRDEKKGDRGPSREGKWESGKGRCAITGRRVLGGTEGLRRVMV
jgi:peroxin-12